MSVVVEASSPAERGVCVGPGETAEADEGVKVSANQVHGSANFVHVW